ncbi:hypothetical protein B0H21DRAFT_853788 [Amylocystis lapponica]|nr:hypothetical protein B0H21DRAFT_853788 [Amylocystis lapponica]
MPSNQCQFCFQTLPTPQGLRSHLAQRLPCRDALRAQIKRHIAAVEAQSLSNPSGAGTAAGDGDEPMDIDSDAPPLHDPFPRDTVDSGAHDDPGVVPTSSRRATVEDVEDEEAGGLPRRPWAQQYPRSVPSTFGTATTSFDARRAENEKLGVSSWYPFESKKESELAHWLMTAGVSQTAIDDYLKLPITRERADLTFNNKCTFFKKIDALPQGPEWTCEPWDITGDLLDELGKPMVETAELWKRNPVNCIRELIGNPAFKDVMKYTPEKLYTTADRRPGERIFDEMWTGDWWWDVQDLPVDATIAPIILSSDKTQLSHFSGDKSAWPPLIECGRRGVDMICADGQIRRVHPIVAAYIADHPEQCLVAGCKENHCPKCTVSPDARGELLHSLLRDPQMTERILDEATRGEKPEEFTQQGIRLVDPFWKDLPHCDIFACITPDLLHQLHKGVFKDHIVSWATACMEGGAAEVDRRFKAMTSHPNLRHFKKGISLVSQWTGTEYKNMEKVFLGVLTGASNPAVLRAVRAVLDFIYYAHFEAHSGNSLAKLEAAWDAFHANKHVFVDKGVRDDFNIAKVHSGQHYGQSIWNLGTADGYNTEASERLHIDFAKRAYRSTNKKTYLMQMTTWLARQEAVSRFQSFLSWAEPSPPVPVTEADDSEDLDTDAELPQATTGQAYHVAKEPGFGQVRVSTIVKSFGCTDFLRTLEDFLRRQSRRRELPLVWNTVHNRTRFPVYKRMHITLPTIRQVSHSPKDIIRATPALSARGLKNAVPAHFDTVLAREFPLGPLGHSKENPLDGLCVARIRAIFRLPEDYGIQATAHPLAYVEWFTPFTTPVANIGMYKVSHSTRRHRRRVSIIPVTQIERSVHLIPHWGRKMVLSWTSADILDQCTSYVNPYLRHDDFVLFCYLECTT